MKAATKLVSSSLHRHPLRSAKTLAKSLQIEWADGLRAEFPYCWLRDVTSKRPALVHLDINTKPEHVEVETSRDSINVLWPRYVNLNYSSAFLRDNANHAASTSFADTPDHQPEGSQSAANQILHGKPFISTHQTPIAPSLVMGQCEWASDAREPGTFWPHLETVPSLVVVDALETASSISPAGLTIIDTFEVLSKMSKEHPKEFEFLRDWQTSIFRRPLSSLSSCV